MCFHGAGKLVSERGGTSLKIHHLWQLVLILKQTTILPGAFSEEEIILTKIRIPTTKAAQLVKQKPQNTVRYPSVHCFSGTYYKTLTLPYIGEKNQFKR